MNKTLRVSSLILGTALATSASLSVRADDMHEADQLAKAKVSLGQAVQLAEKPDQSKTLNAEFDIEKGHPLWEVKTLGAAGVREYKVDANTGAILKVEDEHIRGRLTNFITGMNMKDLDAAKTTLPQAIMMAEKSMNGKAVKVEVEHEHNGIQYDISVRSADATRKVKVDGATGKVM